MCVLMGIYHDRYCLILVSPCFLGNPCQGGGTCIPQYYSAVGYSCICHPRRSGAKCELGEIY